MLESPELPKQPVETPRRKGPKTKTFYESCAIDGKFSPRCIEGEFIRPNAKRATASRSVADRRLESLQESWVEGGEVKVVVPFKKRVGLKAIICQRHREVGQIKLHGNLGHEVLGPTTALELEAECREPILWKSEPILRVNLRTPDVVAIGSAFHNTAAQYFKTGRLQILSRYGLHATIALMDDHAEDVGLTYPLRINSEMKHGAVKALKANIFRKTERCLRQAIHDQILRSRFQIFKDKRVVWAAAEHQMRVPLSTLLRELFGITEPIEQRFDPVVLGELDLTVASWVPKKEDEPDGDKILAVVIDDYKTLTSAPDERTIEYYRKSIQMPIYGALMDLAHLSDWEVMPEVKIQTRYRLIWDAGTRTVDVPYNREIALEALRRYYRFKPYLAKARELGKGKSFAEVSREFFPAVTNEKVCPNCFAYEVCSLTRPADRPMSYLDQLMPTRKPRQHQNQALLFS